MCSWCNCTRQVAGIQQCQPVMYRCTCVTGWKALSETQHDEACFHEVVRTYRSACALTYHAALWLAGIDHHTGLYHNGKHCAASATTDYVSTQSLNRQTHHHTNCKFGIVCDTYSSSRGGCNSSSNKRICCNACHAGSPEPSHIQQQACTTQCTPPAFHQW